MKDLALGEHFPPVGPEEWAEAARAGLKGGSEKKLNWKSPEGIEIRPYYWRGDVENLAAAIDSAPGEFPYLRGSGEPWRTVALDDAPAPRVNAMEWHSRGASTVQELAFALAAAVESFAGEAGPMTIRFGVGPNFFFEIAKLRAARILWSQASRAFGEVSEDAARLRIHAVTGVTNKTLYDANNNLPRATAEALAAVLGGCDWLTVTPFGFDERLGFNLQHILREESHLDQVADAGGGSYYLEVLTDAVAREAWRQFQQIEVSGGFLVFERSGALDGALAESRREREAALATRRSTLVGVNRYADASEHIADGAAEADAWRIAGIFERIRLRTERHYRLTGRLPEVLLLEAGDVKMRKARSEFAAAFFASAGFAARVAAEPDDCASLIVLCSSDAEYVDLARRICGQTRRPVLVAGRPADAVETLESAGVSGFVYLGANAAETLEHWQDRLGMEKC